MEIADDLKLNTPNDEQQKAIEHTGGVLLSAGAGSGKTFVLVEHIVYLFEKEYEKKKSADILEFTKGIKEKFSKIVLMTFTKKASGELSLRLQKRFQKGLERANHKYEEIPSMYWEAALSAIHYMFVGTIHSFCYRLILEGYIPGFTGSEEMISDLEFTEKIEKIFSLWLDKNEERLKEEDLEFIIVNKKLFQNQIKLIFSDTDLRLLWTRYSDEKPIIDLEKQIEEFYELEVGIDWRNLNVPVIGDDRMPKKIATWVTFIETFNQSIDKSSFLNFINSILTFYKSFSRHPSIGAKKNAEDIKLFLNQVKEIRDFTQSYLVDFNACLNNKESFLKFGEVTFDIYSFIEENYLRVPGLTFTDLEYYVWKTVTKSQKIVDEISGCYEYFIIDEFQDTSNVQFEMVKSITNNDMKRIFCVGDVKQAIYGFRGGELGVFKEAAEKTYQTLSLKNNYRSDGNIIDFNNSLFDFLLPLGNEFKESDPYTVSMLKQNVPVNKEDLGHIEKRSLNIEGDLPEGKRSISAMELNYLECQGIYDYFIESDKEEEVCVLYRKLTPVKFLIKMLLESDLGFTCQVKVELSDDPIIFLFCEYTKMISLYKEIDERQLSAFVVKNVLNILKIRKKEDELITIYSELYNKYISFGLWESFKSFLWKLNLSSSHLDKSYELLSFLCKQGQNKAEVVFEKMKRSLNEQQYSIDFQSGLNPERIKIMTMHASKGLEFDTVILGGLQTNGIEKSDQNFFGKTPFSYKWFLSAKKSHIFRSPRFLYEEHLKKKKSFSEAKRLFYVAGTRAVHKLVWFDISFSKKPLSHGKSSWINGIREWENAVGEKDIEIIEKVKEGHISKILDLKKIDLLDKRLDLHPPIFHIDPLGLMAVEGEVIPMGYSCELSVTRLAEISRCPRKFFLKNLIKLDEQEVLELISDRDKYEDDEKSSDDFDYSDDLFYRNPKLNNTAERGSAVHQNLSLMILNDLNAPEDKNLDNLAVEGIAWVKDNINKLFSHYYPKEIKLFSETPIKYSLFGQMISGTPDFYVKGEDVLEVWDFKTGQVSEEKMEPYWFQLYCYAYGLKEGMGEDSKVKLALCFVDEKRNLEKELTLLEIKELLYEQWKKIEQPDQVNEQHCEFCSYEKLCFPSS